MPLLSLALYSLNIERCSITSRTIQKVADAVDTESVLSQLFIGMLIKSVNSSILVFFVY